ncbi:MAG: aggregation factor core [Roseobacter sp.]
MKAQIFVALALTCATPAMSDVVVQFDEGAPKDRFTISNTGTCPLGNVTVVLDLGASAAGLIFDVTSSGAGVSVFQPLELVAGAEYLASVPEVKDGDTRLELPLTALAPGGRIAFTIDVDDTAGTSETMVTGSEMAGATVSIQPQAGGNEAVFSSTPIATVTYNSCSA